MTFTYKHITWYNLVMINKGGRPPKFESVEQLQSLIDSYFTHCDQEEKPYSVTGLALWLDTSRETLINYEEKKEYFDTIKRAKLRCENWVEEGALMNKINATSAIFNLKNNYGWKDKVEQELSNPDGNLKSVTIIKSNGGTNQTTS